jgi:mannose-6-phosphate isomerase-like protein (cupin superfamily)
MPQTLTQFGPVVNDASGMGELRELLGGFGNCRWKQLINGMHLNGPWNCVEYVVIEPNRSCGTHTHLRTEEIYYILSGSAEMELNGEPITLLAGDLVTAPIGTSHGTMNRASADMEFFVVEVFPGAGTDPKPVSISLRYPPAGDTVTVATDTDTRISSVALQDLFTGPWRSFATIELTPGARHELEPIADATEVLFIVSGVAGIELDGTVAEGASGLCVGVPPAATRAIVNRSNKEPLTVLSTIVGLE